MRPIDGDKLMMHLADWWYSSFGREETEESKAIKTVMDKIEQTLGEFALEKQEQEKWIPFKRREATDNDCTSFDYIMEGHLPEDGQTILITIKLDGHEPVQVDTYYGGGGEECYLDSGYALCDEAIAWMPLPEPYTEEES